MSHGNHRNVQKWTVLPRDTMCPAGICGIPRDANRSVFAVFVTFFYWKYGITVFPNKIRFPKISIVHNCVWRRVYKVSTKACTPTTCIAYVCVCSAVIKSAFIHTLHYAWISNFVVCCSLWLPGIGTELSITSCSIVLALAQRNLNVQHRTCTETMAAAAFMSSFSFMHASFLLCSLP